MDGGTERKSLENSNVDPNIYPTKNQHTISTANLVSESKNDISNGKPKMFFACGAGINNYHE